MKRFPHCDIRGLCGGVASVSVMSERLHVKGSVCMLVFCLHCESVCESLRVVRHVWDSSGRLCVRASPRVSRWTNRPGGISHACVTASKPPPFSQSYGQTLIERSIRVIWPLIMFSKQHYFRNVLVHPTFCTRLCTNLSFNNVLIMGLKHQHSVLDYSC